MKIALARRIPIWFVAAALLSLAVQCDTGGPTGGLDADGVAANNRGVAYMGRFDFEAALEVFSALAERYPDNPDIQINLAIATMNRQQEGDEETAKVIFDRVLQNDPSNVRAAYNSGLIDLHRGYAEAALPHILQVTEADPTNAEAYYHVGQCYMQLQQFEEALPWFKRAIEIDPYLRSAYYRAFQATQRLGDRERANAFLERFQALDANPRSHLVEFKYTRMGEMGRGRGVGHERPGIDRDAGRADLRRATEAGRSVPADWLHPFSRCDCMRPRSQRRVGSVSLPVRMAPKTRPATSC